MRWETGAMRAGAHTMWPGFTTTALAPMTQQFGWIGAVKRGSVKEANRHVRLLRLSQGATERSTESLKRENDK